MNTRLTIVTHDLIKDTKVQGIYELKKPKVITKYIVPLIKGIFEFYAYRVFKLSLDEELLRHISFIEETFPPEEIEIETLVCYSWFLLGLFYGTRNKDKTSSVAEFWKCLSFESEDSKITLILDKEKRASFLPLFRNLRTYEIKEEDTILGFNELLKYNPFLTETLLKKDCIVMPLILPHFYKIFFFEIFIFLGSKGGIVPDILKDALKWGYVKQEDLDIVCNLLLPFKDKTYSSLEGASLRTFLDVISGLHYPGFLEEYLNPVIYNNITPKTYFG